jgi:hypothetical protein
MTDTQKSPIPGFSVLLVGVTGTGKTTSLKTLVNAGVTPFVILTEPHGAVLADIPCPKLHWHYVKPMAHSWSDLVETAIKVNTFDLNTLAKGTADRTKHRQFVEVLNTLNNFKCDRCQQEYGDVGLWHTNRAIAIDSMTGLNPMAMALVAGDKPVKAQADWQIAQNTILQLIQKLCTDRRCHFILTGHLERETDEVTGGMILTVSTLGKKLGPQIPRFFDEVIHTVREETRFRWSNTSLNVDLKARLLPLSSTLQPSFVPLIEAWKAKGGIIE